MVVTGDDDAVSPSDRRQQQEEVGHWMDLVDFNDWSVRAVSLDARGPQTAWLEEEPTTEEEEEGGRGGAAAAAARKTPQEADEAPPATHPVVDAAEMASGEVVTLQSDGLVRVWQVDGGLLKDEARTWRSMYGRGAGQVGEEVTGPDGAPLEVTVDGKSWEPSPASENPADLGKEGPKHGKEDAKNEPHVGGNTWAGGTGGSDTAGLGGRGGPYRLDKGHKVHQVSDEAKAEVSAEVLAKARAIAEEELAKRLEDIKMTGGEHARYTTFLERVRTEVKQLRDVLESVKARAKERTWLKHQSSGDLDDAKLIDGVVGERLIFKRRGVTPPPPMSGHEARGTSNVWAQKCGPRSSDVGAA